MSLETEDYENNLIKNLGAFSLDFLLNKGILH